MVVFPNLKSASRHARKQTFAKSTKSIGLAVRRNNRVREYFFDEKGNCVGYLSKDDAFIELAKPWAWRTLN